MKHARKRILSAFAAAAMMLCTVPQNTPLLLRPVLTARAAETSGSCGENLTWEYDSETKTLTISGTGAMTNYYLLDKSPFKELEFSTAVISDGVTGIGDYAFSGCADLTNIMIPESVTSIGSGAFSGTPWLEARQKENPLVVVNGILADGTACSGEITIPDNVNRIGASAFYECTGLTGIMIPNSVIYIGEYAFCYCPSLTELTIPDSVTSIDSGAFCFCTGLTEITLPDSLTSIGDYAFAQCTGLTSFTIPGSVTGMGKAVFENCGKLQSITISDGVTSIGEETFSRCTGLTDITIPDSITSIGRQAFVNCAALKSVKIPDSVTVLADSVFLGCAALSSVSLPDKLERIGDAAFRGCYSLKIVTIPESVSNINRLAFCECRSLQSVTILNPDCEIAEDWTVGENAIIERTICNDWLVPPSYDPDTKEITPGKNPYYNGTIYGYADSTAEKYAKDCGYKFEVPDAQTTPAVPEIQSGDVNEDGSIDLKDVTELRRALAGTTPQSMRLQPMSTRTAPLT